MCGNVCETIIHALCDCTKCLEVWKRLVPSDMLVNFFTGNIKSWIKSNLNYCGISNKDWSNTWVIAYHALWTWRNMEEHDESYVRPIDPINYILKRIEDYDPLGCTRKL